MGQATCSVSSPGRSECNPISLIQLVRLVKERNSSFLNIKSVSQVIIVSISVEEVIILLTQKVIESLLHYFNMILFVDKLYILIEIY